MNIKFFNDMKYRLSSYKFNSLKYTDYSQISNYTVLCNEENCILIHGYNTEMRMDEFQWGANNVNLLIEQINTSNKPGIISFIPDEWISQKETVANQTGTRDCSVIIHRENNEIVGVSCVGIYGDCSPKGTTLWIREIAVNPSFQRRGIGKKLLNKSLYYGVTHGAKRGFLIADENNENALHLYRNIGFNANTGEYAITMIKE